MTTFNKNIFPGSIDFRIDIREKFKINVFTHHITFSIQQRKLLYIYEKINPEHSLSKSVEPHYNPVIWVSLEKPCNISQKVSLLESF